MLIHLICAARPNFMKIAPLYHALAEEAWAKPVIVHTGQHYDINMSDAFFEDLHLPSPDIHLGVGSGTHAEQTGKVMIAYEKIIYEQRPDLIVVVGDVNSTVACTLAASKVQYQNFEPNEFTSRDRFRKPIELSTLSFEPQHRPLIAHLEAGLRSFDRTMPEEINRLVTDALADILWTPSQDAVENLLKEGILSSKIQNVGNIMIDSLEMLRAKIESLHVYRDFGLNKKGYGLVTLHRPSNVDNEETLSKICKMLVKTSNRIPLVFPVHPRTRKNMEKSQLAKSLENCQKMRLPQPLNYIRFMNLLFNCSLVITDSGGIQEETTYLGIPCLTLRPNTERPITVSKGTNQLCDVQDLDEKAETILSNGARPTGKIEYWDGKTAGRIVEHLKSLRQD